MEDKKETKIDNSGLPDNIRLSDDIEVRPVEENPPKFVALIVQPDGDIQFRIQGMELDEAYLTIKKGNIKFEKLYDNALRTN